METAADSRDYRVLFFCPAPHARLERIEGPVRRLLSRIQAPAAELTPIDEAGTLSEAGWKVFMAAAEMPDIARDAMRAMDVGAIKVVARSIMMANNPRGIAIRNSVAMHSDVCPNVMLLELNETQLVRH